LVKNKKILNKIQTKALSSIKKIMTYDDKGIVSIPSGVGKTYLSCKWYESILKHKP